MTKRLTVIALLCGLSALPPDGYAQDKKAHAADEAERAPPLAHGHRAAQPRRAKAALAQHARRHRLKRGRASVGRVEGEDRRGAVLRVRVEDGGGELGFAPQLDGDRPGLRVTVKRGEGTKWLAELTPDRATRQQLARAYDPTGRTAEIGEVIRLEVRAPGRVITSGVLPTGRGVEAERNGDKAILLLPVKTALSDRDGDGDFVWDISWLK